MRQYRPHPIKRTRVVQGLDENAVASDSGSKYFVSVPKQESNHINNAWFRTRIILPSNMDDTEEEEEEDEAGDEADEYSQMNDNYSADEYYEYLPDNKIFEDGDFDYNETDKYGSKYLEPNFSIISRLYHSFRNSSSNFSRPSLPVQSSQTYKNKNAPVFSKNYRKSLRQRWRNITLVNIEGVPIVEDGIFWSDELERRAPKGNNFCVCNRALIIRSYWQQSDKKHCILFFHYVYDFTILPRIKILSLS